MSGIAHDTPANPRAMQGILCLEVGMLFFVVQDLMMKSLLEFLPVWILICIRSTVAVFVLVPVMLWLGPHHRLLTPLWPLHLLRSMLFACGFSLFYASFPFMGLAEITTVFFSAPLFTSLLAVVFLRETIGLHRTGALIVGFIGVIVAINPTSGGFNWIFVMPLLCAVMYASGQILARHIGDRDTTLTMGLYTLAPAAPMIILAGWSLNQFFEFGPEFHHLRWEFPKEVLDNIVVLTVLGLTGIAGYLLTTRAYQVASASLLAPFDYTYLPLAAGLAYVIWQEVPDQNTMFGMVLIILSGLYLGYRELRNARHSDDQPIVADTVFAPGNPAPPQTGDDNPNT